MSLSSLIVQREIASIRAVEEALARQVLYGGDLATNLLEVAPLEEWRLAIVLAESFGFPVAPAGQLPLPSERARSFVPSELALRRSFLPLDADDQRIILVLSEPLALPEEEQIAFALGLIVEQRIALYPRVREALARAYDAPLERRVERLLAKLSGAAPPSGPTSQPPLLHDPPSVAPAPRPPSALPSPLAVEVAPPETKPEEPPRPNPRATQRGFPEVRIHEADVHNAVTAPPMPPAVTAPAPPLVTPPRKQTQPLPVIKDAVEISHDSPTLVPPALSFVRDGGGAPRPLRRRRGPLTYAKAKEELEAAADRDALLDLVFDFCRQFFDYAALFIVRDEIAEGRDAFGDGLSREKIPTLAVPLTEGMLRAARDKREPLFLQPDEAPASVDAILLADLERERIACAFVMPIVVRSRTVALLYGDAGAAGVDELVTKEAIDIGRLAGAAFERIIVRKKLAGFSGGGPADTSAKVDALRVAPKSVRDAPPPSLRTRAEAFKRAVLGDDPPPTIEDEPRSSRNTPFETPLARGSMPPVLEPPLAPVVDAPVEEPIGPRSDRPVAPPAPLSPKPKRSSVRPPPDAQPAFYTPPPPPPEVNIVRKPAGPPIPREEPELEAIEPEEVIELQPRAHMPSAPDLAAEAIDDEAASALLKEIEMQERAAFAHAHAPRSPPSSRKVSGALPSIIVDTDGEYAVLVDRLLSGDEDAEAELLRDGMAAMPAIMARFPGPLRLARDRLREPLPRVSDCGPILSIVARERRVALPFVLPHVTSEDVERRTWSTFLLTELTYPEAVEYLVPRLFDTDPRVRLVARAAARKISTVAQESLLGALGRVLRDPRSTRHGKIGVLETLGEIREPLAVPLLIRYLEDEDEEIATVARRALIQITRQDFARDARKWLGWWGANSNRHRIEWLIDALSDDTPGIRRAAGEELKSLTEESFGFYEDLPKHERERAQQRFRDWWASEGRAKFTR